MQADPTLWCVSAWNDNGFEGMVGESRRLLRTQFFPGLGWLLSRALYKGELEPRWPDEHWDHWMRSEVKHRTSRGRECLYPQVPRSYHAGAKGTFMDWRVHEKYFADIALSSDTSVRWTAADVPLLRSAIVEHGYDEALRARLSRARPLTELAELLSPSNGSDHPVVLWYSQPPREQGATLYRDIAAFFGLWHEMRRGSHQGVHEFRCRGHEVMLANTKVGAQGRSSPFAALAPRTKRHIVSSTVAFGRMVDDFSQSRRGGRSREGVCRLAKLEANGRSMLA